MDTKDVQMTQDVIDAINEELAYQNTMASRGRADEVDHGVAGQLITLQHYANLAAADWTNNSGCEPCLDTLRKVAAVAIRTLELHGCPRRVPPNECCSTPCPGCGE